jgi:hypothetical protein
MKRQKKLIIHAPINKFYSLNEPKKGFYHGSGVKNVQHVCSCKITQGYTR